jgi:threonine aldolase
MLVGSEAAVTEARVWRKRLGGGMRQVGILAAGAAYALDHHVDRLAEDHAHARLLAEACGVDPVRVDTNIVVLDRRTQRAFVAAAREEGCWSRRSAADGAAGHPPRRQRRRRPPGGRGAARL